MKTVSIVTILVIFYSNFCFGQTTKDPISIKVGFGGIKFYQDEQKLNMQDIKSMMQSNPQAYQQIKSTQSANTIAAIIGGIGGVLVGIPIGTAIAGKDANWALAGIGAGLIAVSIPISLKAIKHAKKAVSIYNSGLGSGSFWNKNEMRLSIAGNKIGLSLQF
jgi:uncharacterized membrane protein YkgB